MTTPHTNETEHQYSALKAALERFRALPYDQQDVELIDTAQAVVDNKHSKAMLPLSNIACLCKNLESRIKHIEGVQKATLFRRLKAFIVTNWMLVMVAVFVMASLYIWPHMWLYIVVPIIIALALVAIKQTTALFAKGAPHSGDSSGKHAKPSAGGGSAAGCDSSITRWRWWWRLLLLLLAVVVAVAFWVWMSPAAAGDNGAAGDSWPSPASFYNDAHAYVNSVYTQAIRKMEAMAYWASVSAQRGRQTGWNIVGHPFTRFYSTRMSRQTSVPPPPVVPQQQQQQQQQEDTRSNAKVVAVPVEDYARLHAKVADLSAKQAQAEEAQAQAQATIANLTSALEKTKSADVLNYLGIAVVATMVAAKTIPFFQQFQIVVKMAEMAKGVMPAAVATAVGMTNPADTWLPTNPATMLTKQLY